MFFQVICKTCDHINTKENIDYAGCTNEEGEEYYEYDLYCGGCNTLLFEGSNWGDFDLEEAIEDIVDGLK
jgi:hypothetical protein